MSFRVAVLIASLGWALQVLAVDNTPPLPDPAMQQRYLGLINEFRCMQCQNETLADSNVGLAADLRLEIHEWYWLARATSRSVTIWLLDMANSFCSSRASTRAPPGCGRRQESYCLRAWASPCKSCVGARAFPSRTRILRPPFPRHERVHHLRGGVRADRRDIVGVAAATRARGRGSPQYLWAASVGAPIVVSAGFLYPLWSNWPWRTPPAADHESIAGLLAATSEHPDDVHAWLELGQGYLRIAQWPLARRSFQHADRLSHGTSADALNGLGETIIYENDPSRAAEAAALFGPRAQTGSPLAAGVVLYGRLGAQWREPRTGAGTLRGAARSWATAQRGCGPGQADRRNRCRACPAKTRSSD